MIAALSQIGLQDLVLSCRLHVTRTVYMDIQSMLRTWCPIRLHSCCRLPVDCPDFIFLHMYGVHTYRSDGVAVNRLNRLHRLHRGWRRLMCSNKRAGVTAPQPSSARCEALGVGFTCGKWA